MTTLTEKVLKSFKQNKGNTVLYYAQNTEEQLKELNKVILELSVQNILPQFMEAEEGFVAVEFFALNNINTNVKEILDGFLDTSNDNKYRGVATAILHKDCNYEKDTSFSISIDYSNLYLK